MNSETEILNGLVAPVRSLRLMALEQAISSGNSDRVLQALIRRQSEEPDDECLQLIGYARVMVEARLKETDHRNRAEPAGFAERLKIWNQASPSERLGFLRGLKRDQLVQAAAQAPEWLETETDYVVGTALIRFFGANWPEARLYQLRQRLSSRRSLEALAACEALIQRDPESLRQDLPRLLQSGDAGTRGLAIKGLARLDLDEAVAHMGAMLDDAEPETRRQGLRVTVFLPFDRVRPLLLRRLSLENENSLFEETLLLVSINPDPEVPYRLFELAEQDTGKRRQQILESLSQTCKAIEASGILGGDFEVAMARLRAWILDRKGARFVRQCLARLTQSTTESGSLPVVDPELASRVRQTLLEQPEVGNAFDKALAGPLSTVDRERLRQLLTAARPVVVETASPSASAPSHEEEIRQLAQLALPPQGLPPDLPRKKIEEALKSGHPDLLATAVRTAFRLSLPDFPGLIEPFLQKSHPALVAAAIEYLARFSPDTLFPRLGTFLSSPERRVKTAALEALRSNDPGQAVSRLRTLLHDRQPSQREAALGCLVQFDFSLVRGLLSEFMAREPESRLFATGLDLFAAFPEPENLDQLFDLLQTSGPERRSQVKAILEMTEQRLSELGLVKIEDLPRLRQEREQRWLAREAKRKAPAPAYALRVLQAQEGSGWLETLKAVFEQLGWRFLVRLGIMGLVLAGTLWWLFQEPDGGETPLAGKAIMRQQMEIRGTLMGLEGQDAEFQARIKGDDGTEWILFEQGPSRFGAMKPGEKGVFVVSPFRRNASGTILAWVTGLNPGIASGVEKRE